MTAVDPTIDFLLERLAPAPPKRRPWLDLARPEQLPPAGEWFVYLILSGRGWGKTRAGAEWILSEALAHPESEWAVVAPTFGAARDICAEGPSGILRCAQDGEIDRYVSSLGQIHLRNGSRIYLISATDPDKLRGFNLAGAWADEFSSWPYEATWTEGLIPAIRDKRGPAKVMVTTTPKPRPLVKELLARDDGSVVTVRGSTFDNAENLSAGALAEMRARYEGTRLGRQELYGEVLLDLEGAMFSWRLIDAYRVKEEPPLDRIIVGVDPAVTNNSGSDETGIVTVGMEGRGNDAHFYVLDDCSGRYSPHDWGLAVVAAYNNTGADKIVAERNNGADLVEANLRNIDKMLPIKTVWASRGKTIRAEPIAALYEQGRVHHVGSLPQLEEQMTTWDAGDPKAKSPDRVDALVWAITEMMGSRGPRIVTYR